MVDNVSLPAATGKAAARDVTYSGEAAQAQAIGLVAFSGADDAKTATDVPAGGGTEAAALRVTLANDSTGLVSVDDNASSLTVDAPVATPVFVRLSDGAAAITTLPVSIATAPVLVAGDNNIGNVDIVTMPSVVLTAETTKVIGTVNVAATQTIAVTQATAASLNCTEASAAAILTAAQLIDDPVFVDDAAFTVGTSKVMMAGVQAVAFGATPDVADALDAGAAIANRHRIPFVLGGHPNIQSSEYFTSGAITDDNILPAIAAGSAYVITGIMVTCSNANVTSPSVRIGFGTANVPSQGATNADAVAKVILSHPGIAPGSGVVKGNGSGIIGIGASDEELRLTCTTPTTSLCIVVDWFSIAI